MANLMAWNTMGGIYIMYIKFVKLFTALAHYTEAIIKYEVNKSCSTSEYGISIVVPNITHAKRLF